MVPRLLGPMEPDPDEQEFPGEEDLDWSEETASQLKGIYSGTVEPQRSMLNSIEHEISSAHIN